MKRTKKIPVPVNGPPVAPLTRLKLAVQAMPEAEAEQLWELCCSLSGAEWRAHVARTLGINLSSDSKVTNFRKWYPTFVWNAEIEAEEQALAKSGLSDEEVRRIVIRKTLARADAAGDSKTVLQAVDRQQAEEEIKRKEKELAIKSEALAQAERKLKLLEDKVRRAQEALTQAANSGGITPETLHKIESELKLL